MTSRNRRAAGGALLVALLFAAAPAPAMAIPAAEHCVAPDGTDLNLALSTEDAIITPFCPVTRAGAHWRPTVRAFVAETWDDAVLPAGVVPTGATPVADLLVKLESVRYVLDEGTSQQRSYVFDKESLVVQIAALAPGVTAVRWAPRLRPVAIGAHTVSIYPTLSADFWDGLGTDAENHIPAGESLAAIEAFEVVAPTH